MKSCAQHTQILVSNWWKPNHILEGKKSVILFQAFMDIVHFVSYSFLFLCWWEQTWMGTVFSLMSITINSSDMLHQQKLHNRGKVTWKIKKAPSESLLYKKIWIKINTMQVSSELFCYSARKAKGKGCLESWTRRVSPLFPTVWY